MDVYTIGRRGLVRRSRNCTWNWEGEEIGEFRGQTQNLSPLGDRGAFDVAKKSCEESEVEMAFLSA